MILIRQISPLQHYDDAAVVPLPEGSQRHSKVEIKSNNGNKQRKMGRYYNSERIGEANSIDESDITTSSYSYSSSSSPSTRHLI